MKKTLQYTMIALALVGMSGCASKVTKEPEAATTNAATVAPTTGGMTSGVGQDSSLSGSQINGMRPSTSMIFFDFDRSDVRAEYRSVLDEHATFLRNNPSLSVRLEGHADERGSREYNLALGERRAQSVSKSLTILGVPNSRITTLSYGEEQPLESGSGESAWQRNRRVEIIYP